VSDPATDVVDGRRAAALLPWQVTWAASVLARRERWPHAALITGPAGIGKRALADWLARVLLCETPRADGAPCNACPGCHYIGAGQHPDLRIVDAFDRSDDDVKAVEWIVVDRIRALLQWAELTSHRGGAKVALIDPAERMNAAAANALLKTLEEPPPNTHFLLVSQQPNRLPATIQYPSAYPRNRAHRRRHVVVYDQQIVVRIQRQLVGIKRAFSLLWR
jgi:DNA polymerase-3 subunit delta'